MPDFACGGHLLQRLLGSCLRCRRGRGCRLFRNITVAQVWFCPSAGAGAVAFGKFRCDALVFGRHCSFSTRSRGGRAQEQQCRQENGAYGQYERADPSRYSSPKAPSRLGTLKRQFGVISLSCIGVAQDLVRTIDFYLAFGRRITGIDIRMKPFGQLAVCRLDLLVARAWVKSQNAVEVRCKFVSSRGIPRDSQSLEWQRTAHSEVPALAPVSMRVDQHVVSKIRPLRHR